MTDYLTRSIRRRCADELRNKFADGKLGQAANSILAFTLNKRSLQKLLSLKDAGLPSHALSMAKRTVNFICTSSDSLAC